MKRTNKYSERIYNNMISKFYKEWKRDLEKDNREWYEKNMGIGSNNEYLMIVFKNGDITLVDGWYLQENKHLPQFNAYSVDHISRYYGDGIETTVKCNEVIDTDVFITYKNGIEVSRKQLSEEQMKSYRQFIYAMDSDLDSITQNNMIFDYMRTC